MYEAEGTEGEQLYFDFLSASGESRHLSGPDADAFLHAT